MQPSTFFLLALASTLIKGQHYNPCSNGNGYIPHEDCNYYYYCYHNGIGYKTERCASGRYWNPRILMCDWPENVPECVGGTRPPMRYSTTEGYFEPDPSVPDVTAATTTYPDFNPDPTVSEGISESTSSNPWDPRCPANCEFRPVPCECAKFYQCHDGQYSEFTCPTGLHFRAATKQCDLPQYAGCNLDPAHCCECTYLPTGPCSANYIFQDYNRSVNSYQGAHHCIRTPRRCDHGLIWNSKAYSEESTSSGACDFPRNVAGC